MVVGECVDGIELACTGGDISRTISSDVAILDAEMRSRSVTGHLCYIDSYIWLVGAGNTGRSAMPCHYSHHLSEPLEVLQLQMSTNNHLRWALHMMSFGSYL